MLVVRHDIYVCVCFVCVCMCVCICFVLRHINLDGSFNGDKVLVRFGLVLWHINYRRLFNAKFLLYIYIIYDS